MGVAEDWQTRTGKALNALEPVGHIYNPRRDDWDSSWVQSIENEQFNTQVNWEVDHIDISNIVYIYFDPTTKSPITLLELGYLLGRQQTYQGLDAHRKPEIIIACPDGFWRQGNVEIMCARANAFGQSQFKLRESSGVTFFRDPVLAEKELISRVWSKHKALANIHGYFPFASPFESQRETKMYRNETRGTKIPKGWMPPEKDE